MRSLTALIALVLATNAWAAPRITGPVQVQAGGFAELSVDGAKPGTVFWLLVTPEPTQQDEIGGVLVFTGTPGTTYTVMAVVVDFDAKSMTKVRQQVTFLSAPGPVPPPGPPPTPPTPADPLVSALKAAAATDNWPAAKLAALSIGFKVAAGRVESQTTREDVLGMTTAVLKDNAPDKTPPNVRAILANELKVLNGPDAPLSAADKATMTALFTKLSVALDGASK